MGKKLEYTALAEQQIGVGSAFYNNFNQLATVGTKSIKFLSVFEYAIESAIHKETNDELMTEFFAARS